MNKYTIRLLVVSMTIISLCIDAHALFITKTSAYDKPAVTGAPAIASPLLYTRIIRGEVLGRNGRTIIVKTDDAIENITINDQVSVIRNTIEIPTEQIKPKDIVSVTISSNGSILAVNAIAGFLYTLIKYMLPLLFIALAYACFTTLAKYTPRSHIHPALR